MSTLAGFHRFMAIFNFPVHRKLGNSAAFSLLCLYFAFFVPIGKSTPSEKVDSSLWGKTIQRIEFSADLPLDRSQYAPHIGILPGDLLTRTSVKNAIRYLYDSGRFSYITVDAFPEGNAVFLHFHLRYNYYFNRFSIKGEVDLKGRYLWELVTLPTGQRFTEEKLEEARLAVLAFLRDRGFYLAQVQSLTIQHDTDRQIDVVFDVHSGTLAKIRSIEITGIPLLRMKELSEKFGFRKGKAYDRSRLDSRLENLRKYLLDQRYLAATIHVSESFAAEENAIDLALKIINFGKMRVVVEGYKIDSGQLRKLLPILSGEGITPEVLDEGKVNLKNYLENKGYSEAEIQVSETTDASGFQVFHYRIQPNRKFTVADVRFKGNRAFSDRELRECIAGQTINFFQNSGYSSAQLDEAVDALKGLYELHGYQNAEVIPLIEPVKDTAELMVTFLCNDGAPSQIFSLTFHGSTAVSAEELRSRIKLAPGTPYSQSLIEKARQTMLGAYNDLGYLQAQVTVQIGDPPKANAYPIEFRIVEGTQFFVDRLLVLGNERTRNSVVSKKIMLKTNEPLSLTKLLQTQQGLYGLGVFDQVRVAPQNPESITPYQDVVVRLQESKRFTMRYGIGYQEREKLRGTLEFTDLNILGSARRADIRFRASSIEQQAIFNLQQPQFRALPVESYFTFSALQRRDVSFDSRRFNLSYQFSHPYGSHAWGMLRYNFKNVRILKSFVPASELGREDEPVNLSTFSAAFINDSRDDYLDPTKGFFSSTDFGITTKLIGDHDYISFFSQNSYYRPLPKSFLLAVSVRLGAAHPYGGGTELPISERFFAGGSSSLRGFDTDYAGPLDPISNKPVGGKALAVGSFEMRIPLFHSVHLACFYDAGNVFRSISDIKFSGFSHTLGAGLRIRTPFGPLRADYGYNLNLSSDLHNRGLTRGHLFITVGPPF
jgi:outer membrane protein insertion porin family